MDSTPIRSRYLADRVLVMLLYSAPIEGVLSRKSGTEVTIRLSPFARSIRLNSTRLLDQLNWLKTMGLIEEMDLTTAYGYVSIKVKAPGSVL